MSVNEANNVGNSNLNRETEQGRKMTDTTAQNQTHLVAEDHAYCRQVHLENEHFYRYGNSNSTARDAAEKIDELLANRLPPSAYLEHAPSIQEITAIIESHLSPPSPLEQLAASLVGKFVRLPNAAIVQVIGYGSKYFVWKRDGFTGSSVLEELPKCEEVKS